MSNEAAIESLETLISEYERKIRSALLSGAGAPNQREIHAYRLFVFNLYSALALLRPDYVSHTEPLTINHNPPLNRINALAAAIEYWNEEQRTFTLEIVRRINAARKSAI